MNALKFNPTTVSVDLGGTPISLETGRIATMFDPLESYADEAEYEAIFRDHPPTQPTPPARSECESLAAQFGRSPEAISAQWDDGRSLVLGQKTAASARLADYLARRGWL